MHSSNLTPLLKTADDNDRVHTTFNQLAAVTGRLSSRSPNLQSIPVRGEYGKRMRRCFVAAPGNLLISGDYSQAELRVLAHCSGDPYLVNAFRDDKDIHRATAALVFNCGHIGVTHNQRYAAKAVNFGLIYGMGPYKLAAKLNLTLEAAKQFIADYFEKFQQLKVFCNTVEEGCKKRGYVTTLANRRRYLPEINYGNKYLQAQARRQAINTVIQGSAADLIKLAMIQVATDAHLKELEAQLILQIHDELVLDVPEANAKVAAKRLQQIMSSVKLDGKEVLNVPLKVDVGIGGSWAEAH